MRKLVVASLFIVLSACGEKDPPLGSSAEELTATLTVQRGTYGTFADTFVSAAEMRKNFGADRKLRVSAQNEALLRFDLSSIPANAVINKAELTLYVNGGEDEDDDDCRDGDHEGQAIAPLKVHRATAAWTQESLLHEMLTGETAQERSA